MNLRVLQARRPAIPADFRPEAAIRRLCQAMAGTDSLTIVLNDPQRATRSDIVLGPLISTLRPRRLRVLFATGSHRYSEQAKLAFEKASLAGLPVQQVAWHDCDDPSLASIGSWRGHPWLLDATHALLAIGSCEMHYFAGISGAHKTATVGCMARDDIQANHAHALSPDARPGALAGNPVHDSVARMLSELESRRPVMAINLLQVGQEVLAASAGEPLAALEQLAPLVRETYTCRTDRPADALVLQVEGVLGKSFYQADKAIKNNEWAVRDGGLLVLDAPCPDGVGQDDFVRLLQSCPTYAAAKEAVARQGYRLGDHKAVKLRYLTDHRRVRVCLVSEGISPDQAAVLGMGKSPTIEQALDGQADGNACLVTDAANTCVVAGGQ